MAFIYNLDPRCYDILQMLLYSEGYRTVQEIADEKNISKRSVYYDICKINEWLEANNTDQIEIDRKKGIFITQEHNQKIQELMKQIEQEGSYLFTPMQRVKIIICSIIKKLHPLYIEDFINLCQVSRNTIINDLKVVSKQLTEYNLTLSYESKKGYRIQGDIIRKRAVFFLYFNEISEYYQKNIIEIDNHQKIDENLIVLKQIEEKLDTQYVPGVLYAISVFFSAIENRTDDLAFSDMDKNEIAQTSEYQLVKKYFSLYKESEQVYLALHLLGSRLQSVPMDLMVEAENEKAYTLAVNLVNEFSRIACIEFASVEAVERALYAHLSTSLYRYRYGIQLGNPMLDDIKNEYPELFEITKKACEYLELSLGVPIPDGEIAYITLHFGGFISASEEEEKHLKILIVCPNGVSTGNMLRGEVSALVPQSELINVISLSQYNANHTYDVVISTVKIEEEKDLTIVHPILTDNDRVTILRKCMKKDAKGTMEIEGVLNFAKKYVEEDKMEFFKEDLISYFSGMNAKGYHPKKVYGEGIRNYLSISHIKIINVEVTWQDAIRQASETLLKNGSIEPIYIDSMINKTIAMGPYMFICEGVVLAHAKVEEGARKLGITMNIYRTPVCFDRDKKAQIIMVLSAEDQIKHLKILNDIMTIFSDRHNIDQLLLCNEEVEIVQSIEKILEGEKE